jgi:hypothetical protein
MLSLFLFQQNITTIIIKIIEDTTDGTTKVLGLGLGLGQGSGPGQVPFPV